MEELVILPYIILILLIPVILGILEKRRNEKNLRQLKVRINVNGIRGKSTVTRMTTAILKEAGYHVVGKTTGSAARMMYWNREQEEPIPRKPKGVSIGEQIQVINKAAKVGADALVCECMAVRPEYQSAFEHRILKGSIVVIVNVIEDHLDEMGPTLDQLAWAFGDTIPYNGTAVVPVCQYTEYFRQIAESRGSQLIAVNPESIPSEYLNRFDYKVFSNNCAMALGVAKALDIDLEVAMRGMLKAVADPGILRVYPLDSPAVHSSFVNAFAANEASSTLEIYARLQEEGVDGGISLTEPVIVMNCRPDRVDRSDLFARECFPKMGKIKLMVIGEKAHPIRNAYRQGRMKNVTEFMDYENRSVPEIIDALKPYMKNRVVIGVGNIHGIGGEFIEGILALDSSEEKN